MTREQALLDAALTVQRWRAMPAYTRYRVLWHVARALGVPPFLAGNRGGNCAAARGDPGLPGWRAGDYDCREARTSAGQETDPLTCKTRRGGGTSHHRTGGKNIRVWQHGSSPNSKIFASVFLRRSRCARNAPASRRLSAGLPCNLEVITHV